MQHFHKYLNFTCNMSYVQQVNISETINHETVIYRTLQQSLSQSLTSFFTSCTSSCHVCV